MSSRSTGNMYHPVQAKEPIIELALMPQLAEARNRDDDWTGRTDAAARRRAQTRLNTRAYRKRKAESKKAEGSSLVNRASETSEALVECWDVERQTVSTVKTRLKQRYDAKSPLLADKPKTRNFNLVFPLCPDNLITLLQYNALRALAANRTLMTGIYTTPADCNEEVVHVLSCPPNDRILPPSLLPTVLQQTVLHGDWIDWFPCAEARDRLIQAAGTYDEDDLWLDSIGGLFEGFPDDQVEKSGIIAWSPPWDITGWEMSEGFLKKWGWLFKGVPRAFEATNKWRVQRGEEPFNVDDYI
ncbi:hypothetical protein F4808DRAFT_444201 [Astrocystis sublimbata]|nr:hypothetical protein F4808DRAFT_444201 [Astrocystis sublimbata]